VKGYNGTAIEEIADREGLLLPGYNMKVEARESQKEDTSAAKVELSCFMAKTTFAVGEELPPPSVSIRNNTDSDIELIGPTLTVVWFTLVQPDRTTVRMHVAVPTGRDPRQMPPRTLKSRTRIGFEPEGIWYFDNETGSEVYLFRQEGTYELFCRYENLASNTIKLSVERR
jgi:hypothetical protein